MKEKLKILGGWLRHQFTSTRWGKVMTWYWWAYGVYLVVLGLSYIYRGSVVPEDSAYSLTGFYVIFAAMWFGLLMFTSYWDKRTRKVLYELLDLDNQIIDTAREIAEAQRISLEEKDKRITFLQEEIERLEKNSLPIK